MEDENEYALSDGEDSASGEGSSESDEDTESDTEDASGNEEVGGNAQIGINSSDDDLERERCPVCLNRFIGQELGTPESCEHTFCYECIEEWSKNINTCPIDRTEFNYIYVQAVPHGNILQKIKVKVLPKEAEESLQESVTLCEVCHNGNREDRLLLCDGCDLAYHCECLDPPLFYIPIEEWFCPSCSGVFQNGAVAGPSHTRTRRIIPRTRASEAVRSRVQNLRTTGSTFVPRTSSAKPKKTAPSKKRKRRCYRRSIKKVVTLARTKKDMTNAQKGKLSTRGSTIILTYKRRGRRKRRRARRKTSSRSRASSRVLPIPSAQQRIAKRLGISKPFQGSTVPQIKQPAAKRTVSRMDRLPTHSLFGHRDQLMDFNENFNEDIRNAPSTSSRRCSNDSFSSSTSSINILDSIMAGQKILHTKSDDIVIKTDGSLVIKEGNSVRKITSNQKVADAPSHTPMSVALAKEGVKCLSSLSKNSKTSWKKHADTSKTKKLPEKNVTKSSIEKKNSLTKPITQNVSKNKSTDTKLQAESTSGIIKYGDKGSYKEKSLSVNILQKEQQKCRNDNISTSKNNQFDSLNDGFLHDIPSDCEATLSSSPVKHNLKSIFKKEKNSELQSCSYIGSDFVTNINGDCSSISNSEFSTCISKKIHSKPLIKKEILSDDETNSDVIMANENKMLVKQEVLSDDETNSDAITANENKIQVKQEILSDEETNIDCLVLNSGIQSHKSATNVTRNIKKEPTDSESEAFKNNDTFNVQNGRESTPKLNSLTDINDFIHNGISHSSHGNKSKNKMPFQKIKEEIPSDTEEYSQSLVSSIDTQNLLASSKSSHLHSNDSFKSQLNGKIKKEADQDCSDKDSTYESSYLINSSSHKLLSKHLSQEKLLLSTKIDVDPIVINTSSESNLPHIYTISDSEDDDLPCTQAVSFVVTDSEDDIPCTQTVPTHAITDSEDDLPCTEVAPTVASDSEDDLPCTQAAPTVASDSEDDLPCTQAAPTVASDSEDDLPCTQAAPTVASDSEDDLPCTQAAPTVASDSEDDLPCTQAAPTVASDSEEDLPCTQAVPTVALDSEDDLPSTQAVPAHINMTDSEDEELPCIQAAPALSAVTDFDDVPCTQVASTHSVLDSEIDDLPCTQAAFIPAKKSKIHTISNIHSLDYDLPPTQMNFQFLKSTSIPNQYNHDRLRSTQSIEAFTTSNKNELLSLNQQSKFSQSKRNIADTEDLANDNSSSLLPATQVSSTCSNKITNLTETQAVNSGICLSENAYDKESFDQRAPQISNQSPKEPILPGIQAVCIDSESLPATQISNVISNSDVSDKKLINSTETHSNEKSVNMDDIISNIKQLVNNLSVKHPVNFKDESTSGKSPSQCSNDNVSEEFNIAVESTDSKEDPKAVSSDDNNSKEESTDSLFSESGELSHEKLLEIAKKPKVVTPKKIGIHKHLPQVISIVPIKEHIKIKPSNKRTFSFEEVAKLETPSVQKNISAGMAIANRLLENSTSDLEDSLPPTQKVDYENVKENSISNNSELITRLNETPGTNACKLYNKTLSVLSVSEDEDFPETQIAACTKKNSKSAIFSSLDNDSSKSAKDKLVVSDSEDSILPATQIQQFNTETVLSDDQRNVKGTILITNSHKNDPLAKIKVLKKENNSVNILTSSSVNSSYAMCYSTNDEFPSSDDLPATQAYNNASVIILDKVSKSSSHTSKAVIGKSHKNNSNEKKFLGTEEMLLFKNSTNSNKIKQNEKSIIKCPTSKREKSSDGALEQKKKPCIQNINISQNKELNVSNMKEFKASKRSLEYQKHDKECDLAKNESKNLYKKVKQETSEYNKHLDRDDTKQKIKREICDGMEKSSSEKKCNDDYSMNDQSVIEIHPNTIKQEKTDFNFVKPSSLIPVLNSKKPYSLDLKIIKVKSEKPSEDFLPATQAVNNDPYEDDLPPTQVAVHPTNFMNSVISNSDKRTCSKIIENGNKLSLTKIKKEICCDNKDDEISIIECVTPDAKIQEIIIDDENENAVSHIKANVDIPSMKNENYLENELISSKSIAKSKKLKERNEKKSLKHSSSVKEKKCDNNSMNLKYESRSHKQPETEKYKHSKEEKKRKGKEDAKSQLENTNSKHFGKCRESFSLGKEQENSLKSKSVHSNSKNTKDSENLSVVKDKGKHDNLLKSKSICSDSKSRKDSKDCSKEKQNNLLTSKSVSLDVKSSSKPIDKESAKHLLTEEKLKDSFNNERRYSSEKENSGSRNNYKHSKIQVISLKPMCKKRPHDDNIAEKERLKRMKCDYSLDSSCSSEDNSNFLPAFQNNSSDGMDTNSKGRSECDDIDDDISISKSDKGLENVNVLNTKSVKESLHPTEVKKIIKEDLKEEIANEVKVVLKPFFKTGLISKDDYKDIMRRAVPKIYLNCHNSINPEKIRKLILSYIALLSKS